MKKNTIITSCGVFIGLVIGYMTSIMLVRVTTYISSPNGEITNEVRCFPFSKDIIITAPSAFSYLYPAQDAEKIEMVVDEHDFLPLKKRASRRGQYLLMSQSNLLAAYNLRKYTLEERIQIASKYYALLDKAGVMEAYQYSQDLLYLNHDRGTDK